MLLSKNILKFYSLSLVLIFSGLMSGCGGSSSSSDDPAPEAPASVKLDTNTVWFDFAAGDKPARTKTVNLTTSKKLHGHSLSAMQSHPGLALYQMDLFMKHLA